MRAPPAPPNSPTTMSASRMLRQYITRYNIQCRRNRFLKAAAATPPSETSSDDLSDSAEDALTQETLSLKNESDEVAQWERWRARTLASRPPAPPVILSLRTRRLPPRSDRRNKTVPCNGLSWPESTKLPRQRLSSTTPTGASSSINTSLTLSLVPKPSTAGGGDSDGRRNEARDVKLRHVRSQPTILEAEEKAGRPAILSSLSSKLAQSDVSKDDDSKMQNAHKRTTEAYVKEQLARLHPSDDLFVFRSKTSLYEQVWHNFDYKKRFERRKTARRSSRKRKKVPIISNDSSQQLMDIDGSSPKQAELTTEEQLQLHPIQSTPIRARTPQEKEKTLKKKAKKVNSKLSTDTTKSTNKVNKVNKANKVNKVNVSQTRSGEKSTMIDANVKKPSVPLAQRAKFLQRRPPRKKNQLRVCKTEPSTPFSVNDCKSLSRVESRFLVSTISTGVLSYLPMPVDADGKITLVQNDENKNVNFPQPEQNDVNSFEEKQKGNSISLQPKDGILKHAIQVEDLNVQINQCPLSQLIGKNPTQGKTCVSQPSLNCQILIASILPSDKPRTVRFDLAEVDSSSKEASCIISKPEPNTERANEIEDKGILHSVKKSVISDSSFDSKISTSRNQICIKDTSKKTREPISSKTREKITIEATLQSLDISDGIKVPNSGPLLENFKRDTESGTPKPESPDLGPKYTSEPPRAIDYSRNRPSRNMAYGLIRKIRISPTPLTTYTQSLQNRQTLPFAEFPFINRTEDPNPFSHISTQLFRNESDENFPLVRSCVGKTYIGDEFRGYVSNLPEDKKCGREPRISSSPSIYPSDLTTTSSESTASDVQVLYSLGFNASLSELEVDSTAVEVPFPKRPNYAVLKPPWPDSDGKDILLRPPPKRCSKGNSRRARRNARVCACEISCGLPSLGQPQPSNWKSSAAKTSTLQYLQKRLSQEQTVLRSLRQRSCLTAAGRAASPLSHPPGCACWLLPSPYTPKNRSARYTLRGW